MAETKVEITDGFSGEGVRRRSTVTRALFGDVLQFVDFVAIIITSVIVAFVYHRYALITAFDYQQYAAAGIVGATGVTALLRRDGYYDFDQVMKSGGMIRAITSRWFLIIMSLLAFGFALKISESFSRVWLFAWSATVISLIFVNHLMAASIGRRLSRDGGLFARRIAIVGATDLGQKLAEQMRDNDNGIFVAGVFSADLPCAEDADQMPLSGDVRGVARLARNGEIDDIIITLPRTTRKNMDTLVGRLSMLPVSVSLCSNIHWLDHRGGSVNNVGNVNVLSLYRRPLEGWGGVIKNCEDIILGLIAFIFALPVLLIVGLLIKLQDGGDIFFAQKRHGFNNAVFQIYKFRTMTVAEDGDKVTQATVGDTRITALGGFLRRYSLDELPQLLNVIKGDMSLVGPRPHAMAHNHQYAQQIEHYSGRHKVKPGITGWAQVNGLRGETSENEMMEQRVTHDLMYIDNWSLWFDAKILAMTVWAVLFPKNAV